MLRLRVQIMDQPCHVQGLADELLSEILSYLLEPAPRALNGRFNGNGHGPPPRSSEYGEAAHLDRFRLVCKRFMRIGTPHKFHQFTLRFSDHGFQRLDELVDMQLACYVKTITYMVRPFYHAHGTASSTSRLQAENPELSRLHSCRLQEQVNLILTNDDQYSLQRAISEFTALQEIKLLRLQDEADERLLDFIRDTSLPTSTGATIHFDWEGACSRAITNLSLALLSSKCTSIRFTGPQISPEATLQLLRAPSETLANMGERLTSLDINFHSTTNITSTTSDLSEVFRRFFMAAKNLIAIHIGFLGKTPLDLDLEQVFHHIRWKALRKLSIQGWRLGADEIIALLRRHSAQLREFRLMAVYLRPGGAWRDVLVVLREEMKQLEHLVLRDIDYAAHFDAVAVSNGVEVFDGYPVVPAEPSLTVATAQSAVAMQITPDGSAASIGGRRLSLRRTSVERLRALSCVELGDDCVHVLREQIPFWETWVLSAMRETKRNGRSHWSM
ncbi:hypothetical protein N7461_009325 [Penicillium sp. DV-2018c]|nr:hypothetical protein N7461_009325 [Penicillium sp. DV-2018c]